MRQGMVTYKRAQRVAYAWHGGKHSPLYAFASTGTRMAGLLAEKEGEHSGETEQASRPVRAYAAQ